MNSNPTAPTFFNKPAFTRSNSVSVLNGPARRALQAFDTGYRFSCSFLPAAGSAGRSSELLGFRGSRPPYANAAREGLSADELERLLERNLLPRFDDARPAAPTGRETGFRPELIELSALVVIVGVMLAKLFVA